MFHRLSSTNFESSVNPVKLFCDSCGGQNKNYIVLGMLTYWLNTNASNHIMKVIMVFPIPFCPPTAYSVILQGKYGL